MILRLLVALICAAVGGAGLRRSRSLQTANGAARPLRVLCLILALLYAAAWIVIAAIRVRYPYELEWIGGALRDHCLRVLHSQPLYVPPTSSWFPYEYQPVYFWICAIVMKLTHNDSFEPMRLISIASTVCTAGILYVWVRSLIVRSVQVSGAQAGVWPAIAAGMFLAAYRYTGAWYDTEHLDMLFTLFLVAGGYLLHCSEASRAMPAQKGKTPIWQLTSYEYTLLAGIVFAFAFFTKQQGVLFIAACIFVLARVRSKTSAMALTALCLGLGLTGTYVINRGTHDWYNYYCYRVPLANGIRLNLAAHFLIADLPLFAPAIALCAISLFILRAHTSGEPARERGNTRNMDAIFAAMTAAALTSALLSRAHWGGAENVLIQLYLFAAGAACICAGRLEQRRPGAAPWLYLLAAAQLVVLAYRPDLQVPRASNYAAGKAYTELVDSLQGEGEVLCIDHGSFTSTAHFQEMALIDVIGLEHQVPKPIIAALKFHRYAAIVMDEPPEKSGYLSAFLQEYPNVTRVGITDTWDVTGFPSPSPQRAVYVLRR